MSKDVVPKTPTEKSALTASKTAEKPEKMKEADAAQMIVDNQKEKARLEEEVKTFEGQIEKSKSVPDSPRPPSASKRRVSNTISRVNAV